MLSKDTVACRDCFGDKFKFLNMKVSNTEPIGDDGKRSDDDDESDEVEDEA